MNRVTVDLSYRQVVPVQIAVQGMITCVHGRIWITELGRADVVLEAGATYRIHSGAAVIQALRGARVVLSKPPQVSASPMETIKTWLRLAVAGINAVTHASAASLCDYEK